MKTIVIAIASLILTTSVIAGEAKYVTLTATDGRAVEVEILDVSSDGKEVTVRRKEGGNRLIVAVSTFNDESQSCIKSWGDKAKEEPASSAALKSLLSNGDFEKGSTSWSGDKNIVYETEQKENKVCRIRVAKGDISFFQKINGHQDRTFIIKFKVKRSSDYDGEGVNIFFSDNKGNGFGNRVHPPYNNEWNEIECIVDTEWETDIYIQKVSFIVKGGKSGSLEFDDMEVFRKE